MQITLPHSIPSIIIECLPNFYFYFLLLFFIFIFYFYHHIVIGAKRFLNSQKKIGLNSLTRQLSYHICILTIDIRFLFQQNIYNEFYHIVRKYICILFAEILCISI